MSGGFEPFRARLSGRTARHGLKGRATGGRRNSGFAPFDPVCLVAQRVTGGMSVLRERHHALATGGGVVPFGAVYASARLGAIVVRARGIFRRRRWGPAMR